ncbi:acyl-CoA carboxylase subunit beta [Desulfobulbus rhabdoformis]|uniref:acyl-CoA carboxylase subunit beta n=1 Tax=Desulfobulbus rhabdoformis TaxID=34032 RepID=UPI001963EBB4|nr:acyl-CoA carboxylase subunit beta [Desulfobulbus rhabdoformis]MBM9612729.1 acyl-CoA carboxylase subunit beta [Desulfobulbus rhabdoformis]
MSTKEKLEQLKQKRAQAMLGGGQDKIDKIHAKGKLTARERIAALLDPGTFEEYDTFKLHRCYNFGMEKIKFLGDGIVTGYGKIAGRGVYLYAQDFSVLAGSLSGTLAEKICKIMDLGMKNGMPVIGLNDSGGARIQEGIEALCGYTEIFTRNVLSSGVVPQISGIFGPCAGGAVYSPALTDFIIQVKIQSYMFLTGPKVVKTVLNEDVTTEQLGGAVMHTTKSGVTDYAAEDEMDAIQYIKDLLSYMPQNNMEDPPMVECTDPITRKAPELNDIIPDNPNAAYDMKSVITTTADDGVFFEIKQNFAPNIIIGFARYGGKAIGVVANNPSYYAGVLDIDSSIKGARFIRFCDCFNIPILTFVDVPGFLPGTTQEFGGVIRNGAKMLYAYAESTVPKVTIITRKSYGGAYCAMSSKHLRTDINYSWPTGEIAVMGGKGAVEVLYAKGAKSAEDPKAYLAEKENEYNTQFSNPYCAAERGYIDDVIEPAETRFRIINAFESIQGKRDTIPMKKHGNIPL